MEELLNKSIEEINAEIEAMVKTVVSQLWTTNIFKEG